MTDYDAMTDEELSVAVAERVFGYQYRTHSPDWSVWWCRSLEDKSRDGGGWYLEPGGSHWMCVTCYGLPMHPATSWADAGRVLEKMRAGYESYNDLMAAAAGQPHFRYADRPACLPGRWWSIDDTGPLGRLVL